MSRRVGLICTTAAALLAVSTAAIAETVAVPEHITTPDKMDSNLGPLEFWDGVPTLATSAKMYDYLDFSRSVDTFMNAFGGVSMYAIRQGFRDAGVPDNSVLIFSKLMDSKSLFLTANNDTIYFWSYVDLSKGPLVVETPSDTLGIFDDMWFRYISDFGLAGPDRGAGAKYLLLPPGYNGPLPEGGYFVSRSRTNGVGVIGRAFLDNNDPAPAVARIAYSDEAGHWFRNQAGQSFRFHSGRRSDLKAATFRTDPGSGECVDLVSFAVKLAMFPAVLEPAVFSYFRH